MEYTADIRRIISDSIEVKKRILDNENLVDTLAAAVHQIVLAYRNGRKVLICGNGGSAADAQHIAAELTGRFAFDRSPLNAEALSTNASHVTAVANDYSFEEVYSRLVTAKGNKGDILIAFSTSGKSPNVTRAMKAAREAGMVCVGVCGDYPEEMSVFSDYVVSVPSALTPRVQEAHILIGHIMCELVERSLFGEDG